MVLLEHATPILTQAGACTRRVPQWTHGGEGRMPGYTYICRSCGATRGVTRIELEAARRGLEQFADDEAELAELLTVGDNALATEFEFCPACRALEQIVDVERDGAPGDPPDTSQPYDDDLPDSELYRE
jgi:hypothetical protein